MRKAVLMYSNIFTSSVTGKLTMEIAVRNTETGVKNHFIISELNVVNYLDFTDKNLPLDDGTMISLGEIHKYGKIARHGDIELQLIEILNKLDVKARIAFAENQVWYYKMRYNCHSFGSLDYCLGRFIHLYCGAVQNHFEGIKDVIAALPEEVRWRAEIYVKPVFRSFRRISDDSPYPVCIREGYSWTDYFKALSLYIEEQAKSIRTKKLATAA